MTPEPIEPEDARLRAEVDAMPREQIQRELREAGIDMEAVGREVRAKIEAAWRRVEGGAQPVEAERRAKLEPRQAVRVHRLVRAVLRWSWCRAFLSERRIYRRMVGGRWEKRMIDFPVCSAMWLEVPMDAPEDYREPLWRCAPLEREVWLDSPNAELSDAAPSGGTTEAKL